MTTTTKSIARRTGIEVSAINEAARDLGIAAYEKARKSWTVADADVEGLIDHLSA